MQDLTYQISFPEAEFAENPEPRCPCVLLLDTSSSMNGKPIDTLNQGLRQFWDELNGDEVAKKRVELAIITFGPVNVITDFVTPDNDLSLNLIANGMTPMGEAIAKGINLLQERKKLYKENGILYYRPWIFLITDGAPTDNWYNSAQLVHQGESERKFMFFAIGVEGADFNVLKQISPPSRVPLKLDGLRFKDFFLWLSTSLKAVSASSTEEQVSLQPIGWGHTT